MSQLAFLKKTFDESLQLMEEIQFYGRHGAPADFAKYQPIEMLMLNNEMFRMTVRMAEVISWIFAQKAIEEGELTAQQARLEYALSNSKLCCEDSVTLTEMEFPSQLSHLLSRSQRLYMRILYLDQMMQKDDSHDQTIN